MFNTSSSIYCILPQSFSWKSLQTHTCSDLFNTRASSKAFSRGIPEKANGWMDKKSGWMGVLFCLQGNKCIHMMVIGINSQQYQTLSLFESHVFFIIHSKHYIFHVICCLGLSRDKRCVATKLPLFLKVQASSYFRKVLMSCWIFPYQSQGTVDNTNPKHAFLCPIWWPLPNAPPKKLGNPNCSWARIANPQLYTPQKNPSCVFLWVRWNQSNYVHMPKIQSNGFWKMNRCPCTLSFTNVIAHWCTMLDFSASFSKCKEIRCLEDIEVVGIYKNSQVSHKLQNRRIPPWKIVKSLLVHRNLPKIERFPNPLNKKNPTNGFDVDLKDIDTIYITYIASAIILQNCFVYHLKVFKNTAMSSHLNQSNVGEKTSCKPLKLAYDFEGGILFVASALNK